MSDLSKIAQTQFNPNSDYYLANSETIVIANLDVQNLVINDTLNMSNAKMSSDLDFDLNSIVNVSEVNAINSVNVENATSKITMSVGDATASITAIDPENDEPLQMSLNGSITIQPNTNVVIGTTELPSTSQLNVANTVGTELTGISVNKNVDGLIYALNIGHSNVSNIPCIQGSENGAIYPMVLNPLGEPVKVNNNIILSDEACVISGSTTLEVDESIQTNSLITIAQDNEKTPVCNIFAVYNAETNPTDKRTCFQTQLNGGLFEFGDVDFVNPAFSITPYNDNTSRVQILTSSATLGLGVSTNELTQTTGLIVNGYNAGSSQFNAPTLDNNGTYTYDWINAFNYVNIQTALPNITLALDGIGCPAGSFVEIYVRPTSSATTLNITSSGNALKSITPANFGTVYRFMSVSGGGVFIGPIFNGT